MGYICRDDGYEVISQSSFKGIDHVLEHRPSLIILDEWLADGYGHDICILLKANAETCPIPVILVSAVNDLEKIAASCKADGFIQKPFELAEISKTIKYFAANPLAD